MVDQENFDGFAVEADGGRVIQLSAVVTRIDPVIDEAADLLPLADAEITRPIKAGALLDEGPDDLEPQRLGEFAQFSDRRLRLQ